MGIQRSNGNRQLLAFLAQHNLIRPEAVEAGERVLRTAAHGAPVIDTLLERLGVGEEELARALARHLQIPHINLAAYPLDRAVVSSIPEDLATRHRAVAVCERDDALLVAIANPLDSEGIRAIQSAIRRPVVTAAASLTAIRDAIDHTYHFDDELGAYLEGVRSEADALLQKLAEPDTAQCGDRKQLPVVRLLNTIIADAMRGRASEIQIETELSDVRVRYCVDGVWKEGFRLPKWVQEPLTRRCKSLAHLEVDDRHSLQSGRARVRHRDGMIDLQVAVNPTMYGEKVALCLRNSTCSELTDGQARCLACDHLVSDCLDTCPNCSASLVRTCPACGKAIRGERGDCPNCCAATAGGLGLRETGTVARPPVSSAAPGPGGSAGTPPSPAAVPRRYRALVVDDERDFLHLMKIFLQRSGMPIDIETASNGSEAIRQAQQTYPDLILLDVMMPGIDGFEVCRRLRADVRTTFIPIVMLTALDQPADRACGFLAGTDDYIAKPFDRRELLARVYRVLQRTYGYADDPPAVTRTAPYPPGENGWRARGSGELTANR